MTIVYDEAKAPCLVIASEAYLWYTVFITAAMEDDHECPRPLPFRAAFDPAAGHGGRFSPGGHLQGYQLPAAPAGERQRPDTQWPRSPQGNIPQSERLR